MNDIRDYLLFSCVILFFIGVFVLFSYLLRRSNRKKRNHIAQLKATYDQALQIKDKAAALTAGRLYYAAIRGGRFTDGDEMRIANDIAVL